MVQPPHEYATPSGRQEAEMYQRPQLHRLGTLAELTRGGVHGVFDADGQAGAEGSLTP